jgi:hypothetical protein
MQSLTNQNVLELSITQIQDMISKFHLSDAQNLPLNELIEVINKENDKMKKLEESKESEESEELKEPEVVPIKPTKKKSERKAPAEKAQDHKGEEMLGADGQTKYVSALRANGTYYWKKM